MSIETTNSRRAWTAGEVAEMLGIKESWIKRQAKLRRIPFVMLSGEYRFAERHIEEILRIFEQQPQAQGPIQRAAPIRRAHSQQDPVTTAAKGPPLRARRPRRRAS